MLNIISGKDNRTLKLIRSLNTRSGRKKNGLYFVEGLRIVADTIDISKDAIEFLVFSQTFSEENKLSVQKYASDFICYQVSDSLFEGISDTKTPQGILAVIEKDNSNCIYKDPVLIYKDTEYPIDRVTEEINLWQSELQTKILSE